MSARRKFDLIIWGATGFTGQLVAEYLSERQADSKLRWALAGRSLPKLEALRDRLKLPKIKLLTADSHDQAALDQLTQQTRVICTTVGPYAHYGSVLVEMCARNGTHYCDLCGEVPWMRRMIDSWSAQAQQSGARIVPACGFDSIPSDMGVFYLQREALKRRDEPLRRIDFRLRSARGGPSGGTVASLLNAVDEARKDRAQARILVQPYSLNPEGERDGPDVRDQHKPEWDANLGKWTAPFVMAAINTKIVRRSHALMNYPWGREFRYSEAMLTGRGVTGWTKAAGTAAGLGAFLVAAGIKPTRRLLQRFALPEPGEGPNAQQRKRGYFNIILVGQWADGELLLGRVTGDRDPGYGSTSKMLSEAAVCLAEDKLEVAGGFWTPASAMGAALLQRLEQHAGMSFSVEEKN